MNTRCKLGDLAVITRDVPCCLANVGHIVQITGGVYFNRIGQLAWGITPVNPKTYLVNSWDDEVVGVAADIGELEHPDEWMVPIRPEPNDDEIETLRDLELESQP